jgi:hypothetical protein
VGEVEGPTRKVFREIFELDVNREVRSYCVEEGESAISILLILFGYGDSLFVDVDGVSGIAINGKECYVELCAHAGVLFVVGVGGSIFSLGKQIHKNVLVFVWELCFEDKDAKAFC